MATMVGGLPRDAGRRCVLHLSAARDGSSAEGWCGCGVVGEAIQVLGHADVRWWLARAGGLSCGTSQSVDVLAEEAVVLAS